jgi:ionotropic glutamate receptor
MTPGEELPQVILDSKARHAITWKSAVLLYDNTFDRDMISRCVIALSRNFPDDSNQVQPLSVSVYRIRETALDWNRRKFIRNLLKSLPTRFIGANFMVLVTFDLMQTIMEIARDLKMVNTFAQWFYVVSDTDHKHSNISSITTLIEEGNNVAFIYNYTRDSDDCESSIKCHVNEMLSSFVLGLSQAIRSELAIYGQISDEEWEIIRPSKTERRNTVLAYMVEYLRKTAKCSSCTMWKLETADVWGRRYESAVFSSMTAAEKKAQDDVLNEGISLVPAGIWQPFEGLFMNDVLFPHISHGFRGRTFHIITYHVSFYGV